MREKVRQTPEVRQTDTESDIQNERKVKKPQGKT